MKEKQRIYSKKKLTLNLTLWLEIGINPIYFFDGSLYISDIQKFIEKKEFYHESTKGIILDGIKSLEIDEPMDFVIAQEILKYNE